MSERRSAFLSHMLSAWTFRSYILGSTVLMAGCAANTPPLPNMPTPLTAEERLQSQLSLASAARSETEAAATAAMLEHQQAVAQTATATAIQTGLVADQPAHVREAAAANVAASREREVLALQKTAQQAVRLNQLNRAEAALRAEAMVAGPGTRLWLDDILAEATRLGNVYRAQYTQTSQVSDLFQLPMIGAALGASLLALDAARLTGDKSRDAARGAAGIGLGIAAFTAGRDRLYPNSLTGLYLRGYDAMSCIVGQGIRFTSPATMDQHRLFLAARQDVAETRQRVGAMIANGPAAGQRTSEQTALISAAEARIELATRAIEAADTELVHFSGREQAFWVSVSDSAVSVARGATHRTDLEFAKLIEAWKPPEPEEKADTSADDVDAKIMDPELRIIRQDKAAQWSALLKAASDALERDRRTLERITSEQRYSQWVKDVLACRARASPSSS